MAKFWELFKKIEELPEEKQDEVQAFVVGKSALSETDKVFLDQNALRRSMWVMTPEGVGIITGVYNKFIEVMLTDAAGLNKRIQAFEPGKVSQAKLGQIPEPRRPKPDVASRMGY